MTRQEAERALADHYLRALANRLIRGTLPALAAYKPKGLLLPAQPNATSGVYVVRVDDVQHAALYDEGLCRVDRDDSGEVELTDFGLAVARVVYITSKRTPSHRH